MDPQRYCHKGKPMMLSLVQPKDYCKSYGAGWNSIPIFITKFNALRLSWALYI